MSKVEDLKERNLQLVRRCFYDGNIWTKNEISDCTYISKAGVTNILKELCDRNEIIYGGEANSTGGRKSKQYQLNKDYFHIGKIILSRNKEKYIYSYQIVDALNQILISKELSYTHGKLHTLINIVEDMYHSDECLKVITLSIPGICEGGYLSICDFKELEKINIIEEIHRYNDLKIIVENDVNVASIGFYHENVIDSLAFMYQPDCEFIGVGMMIHHRLYNGFSHFAGELRYLPFYNEEIQNHMLKNQPLELLKMQIETLCCVINPQLIGICSDVLKNKEIENLQFDLPKQHQPQLVYIHDIKKYIYDGLYKMAIHLEKGEVNENFNT